MHCTYILRIEGFHRVYVGSSSHIEKRLKRHKSDLSKNMHHSVLMQREWNISSKKLSHEIYIFNEREEAYELEQFLLDELLEHGKLYNIGRSVKGGDNLTYNPNKAFIVDNIGKAVAKRIKELTTVERIKMFARNGSVNGMYGKTHTPEALAKMKLTAHLGGLKNIGRKHSFEMKAKLSAIAKTRTGSKNPFFGKEHSEETKKLLSSKLKGLIPPNRIPVS